MLHRASMRKNRRGTIVDTSSEHLRKKFNILQAIDGNSVQKDENLQETNVYSRFNAPTMKIEMEENVALSKTGFTTIIDDLDADINLLGIQELEIIDNDNHIYPKLTDITNSPSPKSPIAGRKIISSPPDPFKTPKNRHYHRPNLESTRKSLKQESSGKTISPITQSTISPIIKDNSLDCVNNESEIPDEVNKFLENALGDELYNTSLTFADTKDITNSRFSASELVSEERTPFHRRLRRIFKRHGALSKDDSFISPPNNSILNKSGRIYKTLSQRFKKKIRGALYKKSPVVESKSPTDLPDFPPGPKDKERDEKIEKLMKEVRIQQSIMNQASKALDVCHASKEFISSREEIESQRLLLLADLRKRALLDQLKSMSCSPPPKNNKKKSIIDFAQVEITDIKLTLRKCLCREPEPGETHEWFVVVINEGTNVWASSAVSCPINSLTIDFSKFNCVLGDLKPTLKITVQIYLLKMITGINYNHQDKYHIKDLNATTSCPSPTRFLKKAERPLSPRRPIIMSSSFVSCGYVELLLRDLTLTSPWPLTAVPEDSLLLGTIDLKMSCKLNMSIGHSGFITYGNESEGLAVWNRLWCVLKGHTLMFWNYPREQEIKKPLMSIDLLHCLSESIVEISRSLCAKPRTLLLETVREKSPMDQDSLMVECRQGYTILR